MSYVIFLDVLWIQIKSMIFVHTDKISSIVRSLIKEIGMNNAPRINR